MKSFRDIEVLQTLPISKKDFTSLNAYLERNNLIDSRKLWFAGFDNYRKASNNAVAENLFYGNKKLKIVSVFENLVYHISNSKEGLKVRLLGNTDEKFKMRSMKLLVFPTVDIECPGGLLLEFKVTKNKGIIKEFKKMLNQ